MTVSHEHGDHNYTGGVKGKFSIRRQAGQYSEKGIEITGVDTAHDGMGGKMRGRNVIFNIAVDGIHVCHCGDLGHLLTPEQIKEIGHVDVLLIPVGGFYTIDHDQAANFVGQLKPTVVVPMHFKTACTSYPIKDAEPFVKAMGGAKKINGTTIELNKDNLKDYAGVILLDYE